MNSANKPHIIKRSRNCLPPPSDTLNQSGKRTPSQNETTSFFHRFVKALGVIPYLHHYLQAAYSFVTRQDLQVLLPHQIRDRESRLSLENEQLQTIHPIVETQSKSANINNIDQPAPPLEEIDYFPFELLPWEMIEHIGQFLDFKSAINLQATNKIFRQNNTFLKLFLDHYFDGKTDAERKTLREMGRKRYKTTKLTAELKHLENILDIDNPIRSAALFSILADYKAFPFPSYLKTLTHIGEHGYGGIYTTTLMENEQVATGNYDGTVSIWDLKAPAKLSLVKSLSGHIDFVSCIIQLTNGWIVTASPGESLIVWDPHQTPKKACIKTLKCHPMLGTWDTFGTFGLDKKLVVLSGLLICSWTFDEKLTICDLKNLPDTVLVRGFRRLADQY